jgi:hypothetical protein
MKKIIAIISSCLVAILLAVTITLACVKFTALTVVNDGAMSIRVYKDNSEVTMEIKKDRDEFAKINQLYKESLKENTLASLFQGATGFDHKVNNKEVSISSVTKNEQGTYVLCFIYNEVKTLMINGEKYVNENANTDKGESTDVTYKALFVEVKNTANFTEYNVYLADSGNSTYSYFNVSLIAQQSDLYAYVGELEYQF